MERNPYVKTIWRDHIVDMETGEVIQEGTRFTASRANNIEEGIYNAYEYLKDFYDEITKLKIQLEMVGRAPVNNGTFFDPIDEEGNTKSLTMLREMAILQTALETGATEIIVDDSTKFSVGQEITLIDEENYEDKKILNIEGNKLTVTALEKPFKKGAIVMRSNTVIKNNKLTYGSWGNYNVSVVEVI